LRPCCSRTAQASADIQSALGHTMMNMTRRYARLLQAESANKLATITNGVLK
jgi:hypothetical protein